MTEYLHDEWLYDLQTYQYSRALRSAKKQKGVPELVLILLQLMAERRELNIQPIMNQKLKTDLLDATGFQLFWHENPEEEQLANYLYDLEAKLRNEQIIDFIRAVSPAIYRIFMRLIEMQIPDIADYIHNSKESSYDHWKFDNIRPSDNPALQQLILLLDLTDSTKDAAKQLRELEKSVRNPLAHLIKPFDEEELHRTTGFSSQHFMELLVSLAQETGIIYQREHFYFDQANAVIEALL